MKITNLSVPFLSKSVNLKEDVILIDKIEIPLSENFETVIKKLNYLELQENLVPYKVAADIIEKQYNAALEHIYSHSFWKNILDFKQKNLIYSYLLETRHYLNAAVSRMGKGINKAFSYNHLNSLIAEHSLEEANHNIFFENALKELACNIDLIKKAKPLPATLEWIHVMRSVASKSPLVAAICSGLLEHTAKNKTLITDWHSSLKDRKILKITAVDAIYKHVKVDLALGHGENWLEVLKVKRFLSTEELVDCLNSITYVAEIIYRWCDNINSGAGYEIVKYSQTNISMSDEKLDTLNYLSTLPVFPAQLYHDMFYQKNIKKSLRKPLAVEYAFAKKYLFEEVINFNNANQLINYMKSWLRAISAHNLWHEMKTNPTYSLICGWLLENYHYISLISEHTGVAMSNCTHPEIQSKLILHLKEEIDHRKLFELALGQSNYGDILNYRPLATTIAFTGALCDLAQRNWQAYCFALCYLQLSISNENQQKIHKNFYQTIINKNPDVAPLIRSMAKHDEIDNSLGHTNEAEKLLTSLYIEGYATSRNIAEASIIPMLSWSFLDGIRAHYSKGDAALYQRIGWRVNHELSTPK